VLSIIRYLFSSPETLASGMSRGDLQTPEQEEERVLINEDGGSSVNIYCPEVQEDFARHVATLCNVRPGNTGIK